MKAVILAGGLGTRLSEETDIRPKPLVEVGGKPILWHIMKIYSSFGVNDFIVCLGYKGYTIKEYFSNYFLHMSDVTFDMSENRMEVHQKTAEPWRVTLVDTGEKTMTGGRIKRVANYLGDDEPFCLTYGDGVADVDIGATIELHRKHGLQATMTVVKPPGRFGAVEIQDGRIRSFEEKPDGDGSWINGGFFVLSKKVVGLIEGDGTVWEQAPLIQLAEMGQLAAYHHGGFWQCMDTLRDKHLLEGLWASGQAPWRLWK
ncbi:glucose-1-phosphate cytidylyltransferase [Azospirillum sp. YIM DDC1]|uniref:Glucose-1-phosphate cytidylyltransferase n=1 Tax=Azospirillum aestuarii TaxID=2802052 RepID=A0ABS1I6X9_9PROT|nr:glucose-1-phosphate cytidylyltransferase [Azospirillum aestuarii]MBK4722823.1 glucose-1-phosphate cytidylyltransferase [Azospirillum aestuarii]